jgi:hypothetical protein
MWPTWRLFKGWWTAYCEAAFVGERWESFPESVCQCGHVRGRHFKIGRRRKWPHWLIGRCGARAAVQPFRLFGRVIIEVHCRCKWTPEQVRDGSGPKPKRRRTLAQVWREREERRDHS